MSSMKVPGQKHSNLRIKEQLYRLAMQTHPEDPVGARDRWWRNILRWSRTIPNWENRLFGRYE